MFKTWCESGIGFSAVQDILYENSSQFRNESKRLPPRRDINKLLTDCENAEYHWSTNYPAKRALLADAG